MLVSITVLYSCRSGRKSEEIKNYDYEEPSAKMNSALENKVGGWINEGAVCYGLVVGIDSDGKVIKGLPVKAKVVTITSDSLKMKALEKVSLAEVKGCSKMGIAKGETWWEKDGDLFKTLDDATAYLKEKGWMN
jgi:hypothetical protein